MAVDLILALVGALAFAALAPALGRRFPPATATRLLVPASARVARSTVFVLGAAAFTWMGQLSEVAEEGSWSPAALRTLTPIPAAPAALCALLLLPAAASATIVAVRHGRALVDVHRMCRHQQPVGGLVVVDSPLRRLRHPAAAWWTLGADLAAGGNVPDRVRALLAPPPPRRPAVVATLVALLIATGLATTAVRHTGEEFFEQAATGHPPAAATTTRSK